MQEQRDAQEYGDEEEYDVEESDEYGRNAEDEQGGCVSLQLAFKKFDTDGSGTISSGELADLCRELGADLDDEELEEALRRLDLDGSGTIDLAEFVEWWNGRVRGEGEDDVLGDRLARLGQQARRENSTDIFTACWNGLIDNVREFLAVDKSLASAEDSSEFGEKNTPLHYASYNGHSDIVELLIKEGGAPLNPRNEEGCTPLFVASQQGHEETTRLLLKYGARINIGDLKYGYSPVEVADSEAIRTILVAGCDTARPRRLDRPPVAESPGFGEVDVSWNYRGADSASSRSLAVQGFVVQLVRSDQKLFSDEESAPSNPEDDEEANDSKSSREAVLHEVQVSGGDTLRVSIKDLSLPCYVQARVAARNASGQSEWSDRSNSILCASVPQVTQAPTVLLVSKNSVKVSWDKAVANGCKIVSYRLQAAEQGTSDWETMIVTRANVREATIDKLLPGRSYVFRLVCSNQIGKSKPSPLSVPLRTVPAAWPKKL